jgi:hypothetical protein
VLQVTLFCRRHAKVGSGTSHYRLNDCLVEGAVMSLAIEYTPAYVLRNVPALVLQAVLLREITRRQFARVPALQVRSV